MKGMYLMPGKRAPLNFYQGQCPRGYYHRHGMTKHSVVQVVTAWSTVVAFLPKGYSLAFQNEENKHKCEWKDDVSSCIAQRDEYYDRSIWEYVKKIGING